MMQLVTSVLSRYGALIIQFLLVVLAARALGPHDLGIYFSISGIIATGFCFSGFGLPDGLMKFCSVSEATGRIETVRPTVAKAAFVSAVTTLSFGSIAAAVAIISGIDTAIVALAALWWFAYCTLFFCSQCLIGVGAAGLGSFLFYTSTNLIFLITTVPYLLFAHATLEGALFANALGSGIAATVSATCLAHRLSSFPNGLAAPLRPILKLGQALAASRLLQASLAWIPVWLVAMLITPVDAGILGSANRLMVAVTGVIASLRFSVRPEIVRRYHQDDWRGIARTSSLISTVALIATSTAFLGTWFLGGWILPLLFGTEYIGIVPVLLILLVGAFGEAFGGPVDEVLKMTGSSSIVMHSLIAAVVFEAALCWALSSLGVMAVASIQALAFCLMYAFQVAALYRSKGVLTVPFAWLCQNRTSGH